MPNMPNKYRDERIDPRTGTPSYYNLNDQFSGPTVDWSEWRRQSTTNTPISQPVGDQFEPFGGFKSIDEGFDPLDLRDIPEARANAQSGFGLIGKALGQSVNEMVLGTLESAGYLADIPGIASSLAGNEEEFDNWWSRFWRENKEHINEKYMPIYQTKAAMDGALLDRTAFAAGIRNVATSLSLLVPALGVARGINIAGKLVGMGAKTLALTEAIGAGLASRAAEGTMEAQQYLFQNTEQNKTDLMKKYESSAMSEIDKLPLVMPPNEYGFSPYTAEQRQVEEQRILDKYKAQIDVESKQMAIDGANKVFKANAYLAAVDAVQFMPIFKGFGTMYKGIKGGKALEIGTQMVTEAGEEIYQSGAQAEAYGSIKVGEDMLGPGFSERMGEYMSSNEMKQSAFWGALGGGIFTAAGPLMKKAIDSYTDVDLWMHKAATTGNVEAFTKLTNTAKEDLIYKRAKRNSLGKLAEEMSVLVESLEEQDWTTLGTTKEEAAATIKSMQEDIAFVQEEKIKLDADERFKDNDEAKLDFLKVKLEHKNNAKLIGEIDKSISALYKGIVDGNQLTPELLSIKKVQDQIDGMKQLKSNLKHIPSFAKDSKLRDAITNRIDANTAKLKEKIAQLKESYLSQNPVEDINTLIKTSDDAAIADKFNKINELNAVQNNIIKPKLVAYESIPKIKSQNEKLAEERAKAQKAETVQSTATATTAEELDDIIASAPEEDLPAVDAQINKDAENEAIDASDNPRERYIGKPKLFTAEISELVDHIDAEYGGIMTEKELQELNTIKILKTPEEFVKNYNTLEGLSHTIPTHARLFDIINRFYSSIGKKKTDAVVNTTVTTTSEVEVAEYEEGSIDDIITPYYTTDKKSSDINYKPSGETNALSEQANRATIRQFTMTKGRIKIVDGVPDIDKVGKTMPIDWDYVNDANTLAVGSDIYFVINLDKTIGKNKDQYNKDLRDEDFINEAQILIAQKDKDGVEHIVNALPIFEKANDTKEGQKLKELRNEIWNGLKKSTQRTGIYNTGITTKVSKKYAGRLLVSNSKNSPHEVLKPGEKLILGVATNINGVTIINVGKNITDAEYSGIVVDNSNDGGVFIMLRGANGRIIPARCFTQKITRFPKLLAEAKQLLLSSTKDNWAANREELRKIVFFDYNYIPKTDSFEVRYKNGRVNTYTKNELDKLLKSKIVQVSSSQINRGTYNNDISKEGRLSTDLNQINNIANANFEFSLDYTKSGEKTPITVLPKEADDIVGDTFDTKPVVKIEEESLYRREFDNVEDLIDVENKLFEIRKELIADGISTVKINKELDRLTEYRNTLIQKRIASKDDIEAKKADVEKRRQDELNKIVVNPDAKTKSLSEFNDGDYIISKENGKEYEIISKSSSKVKLRPINTNYQEIHDSINGGFVLKPQNASNLEIDTVNSKYDAELAALETPSTNLDAMDDMDNPMGTLFRLAPKATVSNKEFYQKWDELKETQWFKDKFKDTLLDTEKFRDGLINVDRSGSIQAWGMFKNAIAYISGSAQTGTVYHEAFHVVFHLYMNASQRAQLLKEGAKRYGKTDRIEIEEAMADEFMEYVQTEEQPIKSISGRIKAFFRHLYQLIKSKVTNDITIDNVFYKTQNTGWKNAEFTRDITKFKIKRWSIKLIPNPYEAKRRAIALADFMRLALDSYIAQNPDFSTLSRREVLSRMTAKSKSGEYKGLDIIALNARASIMNIFKNNSNITEAQKASVANMLASFIKYDAKGNVVFEDLGRKALMQFAKTEGLKIKIASKEISKSVDSTEGEPLMDFAEEETTGEGWQTKAENISGKESLSNNVRKELSYIPKIDTKLAGPANFMQDDLGFTIYQDFNTIYADLQRDLSDVIDSDEMMEILSEIAQNKPYLTKLVDKVMSDNLFRTEMFVNFSKSHVDYKIVVQSKKREHDGTTTNEFRVVSANRLGVKNILIDEWKDNSTDPTLNKVVNEDGSYKQAEIDRVAKAWASLTERMRGKNNYDNKDLNDISRILNYVGITITLDDLKLLNKDFTSPNGKVVFGKAKVNEFKFNADKIINKLTSGVNPFGATSLESEAMDNLSKIISKFRFELMESSFKNAENNTVYAHQVPTFLSRAIAQFKGKNAIDKINWYQNDPDSNGPQNGTPFYNASPWLTELREVESRNNFEFIEIDAIKYDRTEKGVRYKSMSEKDFENTAINMYFNNGAKDYTYFKFPVVSDAPKMPFIKFRRYSNKDVINRMFAVYQQEKARIVQVQAKAKARAEYEAQGLAIPDELKPIKNYDDAKSEKFLFLSFLNTGNYAKAEKSGNEIKIKEAIQYWLDREAVKDFDRLKKLEVFGVDSKGNSNYDTRINGKWGSDVAFHKDYFYNSILANTQMMSIFSGDPAFYKADKKAQSIYSRTVDYQKRNKQNVSPKTTMDVKAIYNLTAEQAATEGKNTLSVSSQYNTIYVSDLEIPSAHAEDIYNTIVGDNTSNSEEDLAIQQMAGNIAGAYGHNSDKLINVTDAQAYITLPRYREIMVSLGRWNKDLQDIYPKLLNGTASGKELQLVLQPIKPFYFGHTKVGNLIIPTQNKNSEYLLLPQLVKKSPELSKLYDYMINNNIASANFNSAVKAGEFGAQPIDNIEQASVHQLNNDDYGLQQETPEHHIDSRSLFGSQIRKLILSDISPDAKFDINGQEFSRDELQKLYHDIIVEDLKEDYYKVEDRFEDIEGIHDLLLGEILDRDLGEEREKAIEIVPRKNYMSKLVEKVFNLPLWHPFHAKSNESLLDSVFKNNVTKQKIKGGAFVQVSAFGFDKSLNLIMNGKRLVGAEVMLPWWSKKFFDPLLDKDGQLDINKVPANLREMIGYRIPTEDKYSMLPLIVKGFLPASAGGAVMLPMEITTISGSDFDIDKMYIMMPEFETSQDGQDIRKVEYDYTGGISTQSKQARNNAKIDIMRAILTHSDTFAKIFKPGGFPTLESLAVRVLKAEGKADEMLSIALPSTQTELFKRNMTGKQLIGIFANHNTSHAILQFTNIDLAYPVEIDGKSLSSLHEVMDVNGDFISRNVAEWLAAVVDNAKNPLSSFINVNTYTADVTALLTRLGYPLETVVGFLSQPILKEFSRLYFNYGADKQAETKVTKELQDRFNLSDAKIPDNFKLRTEALFGGIEKAEIIDDLQYAIFNQFLRVKEQATALADLVRATRADTKGAGPTLSENEKLIELRKDVLDSPELLGIDELFFGDVYPMEPAFMEYGVTKPTELLAKYFPWFSPAWKGVKSKIAKGIKANKLTVKQIEQINYELLGFAATGFDFFDGRDRADIVNNMSQKIRAFKAKYPTKYEENFFLNKLVFKKDDTKPYLPERVQFKNTGSLTEIDKQQIKEDWLFLMKDADLAIDEEFSSFANDLVKYAFYTAGFQLTPNSFSHLIPVDFYSELKDEDGVSFNDYLSKTIDSAENSTAFEEFTDQFFRNNSDDLSFVPAVDTDGYGNISGKVEMVNGLPGYFVVDSKDEKLRKDFIVGSANEGKQKLFSPFVSLRLNGTVYLFQNMSRSWTKATYVLTTKLGIPNANLEYEKNENFLESVIPSNNLFTRANSRAMILEKANIKDTENIEVEAEDMTTPEVKPEQKPASQATMITSMADITNHSGGALGSDISWDQIGSKYGMTNNMHYYMGEKTPHGNTHISKSDEIEGQQKATIAARQMGRIEQNHQVRDVRLIRNWAQVKYSDAIFAITTMLKTGSEMNYGKKALISQGKGGTGYAIQMAINEGKPVYLFDQVRNKWFSNIDGKWSETEVPTLTKNFAGIGTREINQNGIKAINDVFKETQRSLASQAKVAPTTSISNSEVFEANKEAILNKFPDMTLEIINTMTPEQLDKLIKCL